MLAFEFIDPGKMIASEDFKIVESFLKSSGRNDIGWHYITDLVWIYSKVKSWPRNIKILDAGGGRGPAQFLLAEIGFNVTNIDLFLQTPPRNWFDRYGIELRKLDSYISTSYQDHLEKANIKSSSGPRLKSLLKSILINNWKFVKFQEALEKRQARISAKYQKALEKWRNKCGLNVYPVGRIEWIIGNLCKLPEISDGHFDAVISLSALEHVPLDLLELGLNETRRILKKNAHWAVTTSGTEKSDTWFHQPSKGLCFSTSDLTAYFQANRFGSVAAEDILEKYRRNNYLKKNIADVYKKSEDNGMPWGKWNPQYIPVGIFD